MIIKWNKPAGDENWKYKITISNNTGSWTFSTPATSYVIDRIPLTTPLTNSVKIKTCTEDLETCNEGVGRDFTLPFMGGLDRAGSPYFKETNFPNQELALDLISDGVAYAGNGVLLYTTIEDNPDDEIFTTIGWGNMDRLLRADGFYDPGNNFLFIHTISTGEVEDIRYLKLFRLQLNTLTGEENYSVTLIDYGTNITYSCADFLPPSTITLMNSSSQFIYAANDDLYIANENSYVSPRKIYSTSTTIAACRAFKTGDGATGIIVAENRKYDPVLGEGDYILKIFSQDEGNFEAQYQLSLNSIKKLSISTGTLSSLTSNIPLILLTYSDSSDNSHLVLLYNNGTTWVNTEYSETLKWFKNSILDGSDLYIDILSNTAYAGIITHTITTNGFFYIFHNYARILTISTMGREVTMDTEKTEIIQTGTSNFFYFFSYNGIKISSPDSFYLHISYFLQGSTNIKKYVRKNTQWTPITRDTAQYGIVRGRGGKTYVVEGISSYSNDIFMMEKGVPQGTNFTSADSPSSDFGVIHKDIDLIGYASSSYDFYINDTVVYDGSSSISYITVPDYLTDLPVFNFWNDDGLFMVTENAGNWSYTKIAGPSGLCQLNNPFEFYAVTTTASDLKKMVTVALDNSKRIYLLIWDSGRYSECLPIPYTIQNSLDHMALLYANGNFYLAVSQHSGSGSNSGEIITDILAISPDTFTIKNTYRIQDDATMAVPVPSSRLDPGNISILYYNPIEGIIKWTPFNSCNNGECSKSYPLFNVDLWNNARERKRPNIYTNNEGETIIEFTDQSGRVIRVIP